MDKEYAKNILKDHDYWAEIIYTDDKFSISMAAVDEACEIGIASIEKVQQLEEENKELKEKQTPKKPFRVIINGELDDELCPTCNSLRIADNYHGVQYNHCPDCGQKLDWSEV